MKTIIITEGDPTGISPELFESSISFLQKKYSNCRFIYSTARKNYVSHQFQIVTPENVHNYTHPGIYVSYSNIIDDLVFQAGEPSELSGRAAYLALSHGIELQRKTNGNIVTLPLSKEWVIRSGMPGFRGHTEYLAEQYSTPTIMMMAGPTMKVIPLTTHIPLSNVPAALSRLNVDALIKCIQNTSLLENPKILFCGLNPHAGENGKIGDEEETVLKPIIAKMRKSGLDVSDPYPADSAFFDSKLQQYDLILACYHDQGLIPFKMKEGKNGVNITLGLDFVRVSPDHGTAFDIAGKGIADNLSFLEGIRYAS